MLDALVRSGYISHYTDLEDKVQKGDGSETDLTKVILKRSQQAGYFQVFLKYHNSLPAMQNIQRISSPGKRIYFSKKKLKRYAKIQNWGLTKTLVLSTSKGIFTHQEILKSNNSMGGESLCFVW